MNIIKTVINIETLNKLNYADNKNMKKIKKNWLKYFE
jgi:hypothetical protein